MHAMRAPAGIAHRRRQPALNRIGRRQWGVGSGQSANLVGRDAAAEPAGKTAGQHRRLGFQFGQRIGPGGIGFGLRAAKKCGADLHGARPEDQCGGDAAAVRDPAGCDDRQRHFIGEPRHQGEQPDCLVLRRRGIERAAVTAGLHALPTIASAPAASAARASASVVAQANQEIPRDLREATNLSGKSP